jgi:hypothetical protein
MVPNMSTTTGQLSNTTQATTASAGPGTVDTAAVDAFNAQMGTNPTGAAVEEITDAELEQKIQDVIIQQIVRESFQRLKELESQLRS